MMTRYLSGLCVAGLGVCGGGWLVVAAVAFGGMDGGDAGRVNLVTGAGLMVIACVTAVAWAVAWRRRLRADGVLGERFATVSRRQARRNRRELTRDVRRAARSAKRSAREARRRARRFPRLADGELDGLGGLGGVGGVGGLGGGGLGGGLTGTGSLGSGLSGGGLGEPRGWIGGGWAGHAPHGTGRDVPVLTGTGLLGREPAGPELAGTGLLADAGQGAEIACQVPGQAGPSAAEVLGQLRILLGPLLTAAEREPSSSPLPQRQPGQERPAIPRRQAGQAGGPAAGDSGGPAGGSAGELAGGSAGGSAGGLLAGDQELLNLAEGEEAWW
jgi:hypothetical protein